MLCALHPCVRAGTDANVTATLIGELGQTPATRLENSKNNFERGQVGAITTITA
jgi:hypothetical protein